MHRIGIWVSAITSILALGAGTPASAAPAETRCQDLGNTCVCSEPLSFPLSAGNYPNMDPPDSEGAGARECNGGNALGYIGTPQPLRSVSGSSVGLPQVDNVLRHSGGGTRLVKFSDGMNFTNSTWCQRHYRRIDSSGSAPIDTGDDNFKWSTNAKDGNTPGLSSGFFANSFRIYKTTGAFTWPFFTLSSSGGSVTFQEMQQSWVRWEICYDHNLNSDNRLTVRARMVKLSDGETANYGPQTSTNGSSSVSASNSRNWAIWAKTQYYKNPGIEPDHQYFTHLLVAKKTPANAGFWIGPAYEIESGSPPPPGPPPPSPPAAPTLLD